MRNSVINCVFEAARQNPDIIFLTGDIGYSVVENFQRELPKQFYNVGISEQNMIGLSAGLALAGKKVFVYAITPFATLRCLEQIRLDVCYQNLDVTVIGLGSGFAYGTHGTTHYGLEDLSVMRTLPNMKVVAPSSPKEGEILMRQVINSRGPWYVRLNRGGENNIFEGHSELGKATVMVPGKEATIFTIGAVTEEAIKAAKKLAEQGISAEVIHMHTLKPLDVEIIKEKAANRLAVVTVEEHMVNGGLGSAVAEVLAENRINTNFKRLGVEDKYFPVVGKQEYMRQLSKISSEEIAEAIRNICQR